MPNKEGHEAVGKDYIYSSRSSFNYKSIDKYFEAPANANSHTGHWRGCLESAS